MTPGWSIMMTEQALRTEIASLKAHVAGLEAQIANKGCKHEWRQWFDDGSENGYFCVYCLKGHD